MAAKSRPIPSPMQIYADQWAAWRTSTLAAAVELDVFTAIDEGKRTADIFPQSYAAGKIAARGMPPQARKRIRNILESICAGRQSVCLSAKRLKTLAGVPIDWEAQQRLLAD